MQESNDEHRTSSVSYYSLTKNGMKRLEFTIAAVLLAFQFSSLFSYFDGDTYSMPPAQTLLYSPDIKVPRTEELALRRAIPANPTMKLIHESLEDKSYLLRIPQRKPYGTMEGNVKKSLKAAVDGKEAILASMPLKLRDKRNYSL